MVEFVYGLPGSGKTSYIISRLAIDAKAGRRAFLIVPEQATVDVEGELAAALPPSAQLTVEALNFSRLANRVFRERGGLVSNYADKSRKLLFMWRALRECAPFLSEYGTRGADAALFPDGGCHSFYSPLRRRFLLCCRFLHQKTDQTHV